MLRISWGRSIKHLPPLLLKQLQLGLCFCLSCCWCLLLLETVWPESLIGSSHTETGVLAASLVVELRLYS